MSMLDATAPETSPTVRFESHGDTGVIRIDNPPVNAISREAVIGLVAAVACFEADPSLRVLLLHCDGRTFVAGGDINSFDDANFSAVPYNLLLARLERLDRPVVAALHGSTLGGGLELALACHYRVAAPDTSFGLPEVKLGLLLGSLGTQRLPRLVGAEAALDLITTGRTIDTRAALELGLIDEIAEGQPLALGLAFARRLGEQGAQPRRISEMSVAPGSWTPDLFAKALKTARTQRAAYPAESAIVKCVEAASTGSFAAGEAIEAAQFEACRLSDTSKAMRHLFRAERKAAKIPGLAADIALRRVQSVGIVGAGTMGGGIAMNFANAGLPVTVVETSAVALERGMALVRKNYESSVARGRLDAKTAEARIALLRGTLDDTDLAECDLVIEAVFENMELKKTVCARLGQICKPGTIIASNTSTLDIDRLADATGRPPDVAGMHFFSPANVMRLLEVVRGARTSPDVLATVMRLARRIGKVAVVSGVCYGFIGNRMAEVYMREAEFLMMEGATPSQIDGAVEALGMAMGPCRMLDMAGIDVGAKTIIEYGKEGGLPADDSYRAVVRKMFELGRFGQKTGAGYYRYEGRTPVEDLETSRIAEALSTQHGIARRSHIDTQEIVERLLYPLINEGVKIIEEGIAYRAGDIDVVWTAGYGFPDHRGGPMFMADGIGLARIVERLAHYAEVRGNPHGYWTPSAMLEKLAATGGCLAAARLSA